ncbi:hypothetical protein GCK72_018306 [Caenorhabditis remanei]|uniref:Protein containing ALS2cr12 (ALS2CR12) signature n=1 Tax=Caenorhabditis remanei TaxID=31234 RepID=A0A6A5GBE5_CAERE|nr:hypothetical protein GCK72_018306 [Caenorhabditis remanei]KAF1751752.1 hypothetical protein GCK72_018306 [Caenorhabditis remanei]
MDPVFLGCIVLASQAFNAAMDAADRLSANPKARVEALKKMSQEREESHQEAMKKLKESQEEFESSSRRKEEEANERIRAQKEENNELIESHKLRIKNEEEKHEAEVKMMNQEHLLTVQKLKSESKEVKEKAEIEHKMKVDKMEKEYKNESESAKQKLEIARLEGKEKVAKVEKEKEELVQQRRKGLDEYVRVMTEMHEIYLKHSKEINDKNRQLKLENAKLRRKEISKENNKALEHIKHNYDQLLVQLTQQNSRNVLERFRLIANHAIPIHNSLKSIRDEFNPGTGTALTVDTGRLDPDFEKVREEINRFNFEKTNYTQYVMNTNLTDPRLFKTCSDFITQMSKLVGANELSLICSHMPRAIDNGKWEDARTYARMSTQLCEKFSALNLSLENGINQLTLDYTQAPEARPAIQQ